MAEQSRRATSRRPYRSLPRHRRPEQTRAGILAAARDLLRSPGYVATTGGAIASTAQVSDKTVEAAFGSKRGILAATVDRLAAAGPPHDVIERLRETADPRQRLQLVAELSRRVLEASVPEFELMRDTPRSLPRLLPPPVGSSPEAAAKPGSPGYLAAGTWVPAGGSRPRGGHRHRLRPHRLRRVPRPGGRTALARRPLSGVAPDALPAACSAPRRRRQPVMQPGNVAPLSAGDS